MNVRQIGDLSLARVLELTISIPATDFFPDTTEDDWAPHADWLAAENGYDPTTGELLLPVQSYVVRTSHHTIVVDTCIGNDKQRPDRPAWHLMSDPTYMNNLAAAGVSPDDVDYVMCTHLHIDHVGWNTQLVDGRWVPTFPNARYLFSKHELETFSAADDTFLTGPLADSVHPIVDAGQAELVTSDHQLDDEVWLEPTPGHTPDHFAVRLASGTHHAVIGGDLMHSPVQCRQPELRGRPDWDPDLARTTRREFMERHCEANTLVCMAHFPLPSAGHFVRHDEQFRFEYDREQW